MRKYQPIWNKLKKWKSVSLKAPIDSHSRIIQAVRKERAIDMGWRLQNSESNTAFMLKSKAKANILTFTLIDKTL